MLLLSLSYVRFLTALIVLLLAPSLLKAQGFGQGLLKSKRTVSLHRKLPATVHLKEGAIGVKAASRDPKNTVAVQKLVDTLQAELLKYNNQFKIDDTNPDTLVFCNITDFLLPGTKIVSRVVPTPVRVGNQWQTQPQERQFQEVTGSMNVAYQVKERSGKVLDADNLVAKYAQEFDAGGNKTEKSLKLTNPFKKKSAEERTDETPPTAPELERILISKIVLQVAAKLTNTDEKVEVRLARGGALDQYNDFAEKGLWNRYLEPLETMKPLDSKEDDAFRLYNIGVGYEALAYQAEDNKVAKKYLDEAAVNYGRAVDANSREKDFLEAQNRIATAQAHYSKLGAQKQFAKTTSEISARATPGSPSSAKPEATAASHAAEALTNIQVIEFIKQGLDEDNLIAIIKDSPKVDFDMSVNGQMELVKGGVKGKVLMAMRSRVRPAVHRPAPPAPAKK